MDIRQVPLNDLVLDPNLNLRDRLDDFTVERYADSWDRLPPIVVFEVYGKRLVGDWFHPHRAAAERAASRELVAKVRRQLIEGNQIPNNPGRVGSDGKLYTSAGLPKDP